MTGQQSCPDCGRTVWEAGRRKRVESARDRTGEEAFGQWVDEILAADKRGKTRVLLEDLAIRFEEFCQTGTLRIPEDLNRLTDEIWEFKVGNLRAPFFTYNASNPSTVRITHGFVKRGQKCPPREIRRAWGIMREDKRQ